MVKLREAKYCNFKLLLIVLVVFGHLIEPKNHWLYHAIYAFHMPAFAMLSGLFSQKNQLLMAKKLILWYIVLQTVAVLFGKTSVLTPYWHLWYLLSNVFWLLFGLAFRKCGLWMLFVLLLAGILIGYVPQLARTLSLSRTIVFFPYYWVGQRIGPQRSLKKYKALIGIFAAISMIMLLILKIPTNFFYHATAYGEAQNGALLRMACYVIGFSLSFFLLAFMPERRFAFTKLGTDTLSVYLFHAPIVLLLRKCGFSVISYTILSVAIVWMFYKLQQGDRCFCGIMQERGRTWHHFKSYTSNTHSKFTDSCSP